MKKKKNVKYETEEQKEVKKFIYVIIGLVIIIVGIYFFTRAFITKDLFKKDSDITYTDGVVNDDVAIVGTMLNRPYEEYYVLAFDSDGTQANYYNGIASKYMSNENSLKIYYIDLNNALNKKYIAGENDAVSTKFETIENLKMGEITLFKVKNQKVTKMLTDVEKIKEELTVES